MTSLDRDEKLKSAVENCLEALQHELSLRKENTALKKRIAKLEMYNELLIEKIHALNEENSKKQKKKKTTACRISRIF